MAVGVALPDAAVGAVDQELGALVAGDGAGLIDGGGLGIVDRRGALGPGAPYGPTAVTRDNMLISLGHFEITLEQLTAGGFLHGGRLLSRQSPDSEFPKYSVRICRLRSHSLGQQEDGLLGGRLTQAARAVWMEGEVQVAIRELSDADILGLQQTARALVRGCRLAPDELLSEAIGRLLEGARKVPRTEKFLVVLRGVMRSVVSNDRKLHDNSRVDSGDDEKLSNVQAVAASPEDELASKRLRESVLTLFDGDEVTQAICEGWFFEQMTEKELCELTGLGATELASKKRAITRKLGKSGVGAHLR
ncbi:MAG: Uncharacterized protein FD144_4021 [Rhodospirillaceae bacterium]|nr:MAG: Uncharacterized protein FD144_4021 [Rhodospirillaceae bacterium]